MTEKHRCKYKFEKTHFRCFKCGKKKKWNKNKNQKPVITINVNQNGSE